MIRATHQTETKRSAQGRKRATGELAIGLVSLLAVAGLTTLIFDLSLLYLIRAIVLYGIMAKLVLRYAPLFKTGLGAANRVTLARSTIVLSIASIVPEAQTLSYTSHWWIVAISALALGLDGVDGWLARRTGTTTTFGARFDMELDSFLMLALAALVCQSGRMGSWVFLLGLPRYLFVVAGWLWSWLRAPLPERLRRKAGCVVQGVTLLACLTPVVPNALATLIATVTLALLACSFTVDIVFLHRQARATPTR